MLLIRKDKILFESWKITAEKNGCESTWNIKVCGCKIHKSIIGRLKCGLWLFTRLGLVNGRYPARLSCYKVYYCTNKHEARSQLQKSLFIWTNCFLVNWTVCSPSLLRCLPLSVKWGQTEFPIPVSKLVELLAPVSDRHLILFWSPSNKFGEGAQTALLPRALSSKLIFSSGGLHLPASMPYYLTHLTGNTSQGAWQLELRLFIRNFRCIAYQAHDFAK